MLNVEDLKKIDEVLDEHIIGYSSFGKYHNTSKNVKELLNNVNNMKNTLVVNFIAPPSAGKSTLTSGVFAELKFRGIDCEIVSEFAKELVWEDRQETFKDELYIFAKQSHRLFRVNGKVDVILTDRPLILTQLYNNKYGKQSKELDALVLSEFNSYNNLNYYVNRVKKYNPNGRNQTEEESDSLGLEIKNILNVNGIDYKIIDGNKESVNIVVNNIIEIINKIN